MTAWIRADGMPKGNRRFPLNPSLKENPRYSEKRSFSYAFKSLLLFF